MAEEVGASRHGLGGLVQPRQRAVNRFALQMVELGTDFLLANDATHEDVCAKFSGTYCSFTR